VSDALVLWCSSHDASIDPGTHPLLGQGLDAWRVEGRAPVLCSEATGGALRAGDVYLFLNRVDDNASAIKCRLSPFLPSSCRFPFRL